MSKKQSQSKESNGKRTFHATIGPADESVGMDLDLEDLLGTYRDTETGQVFQAGFDGRHGVIYQRDFLTGVVGGDGEVPELFDRRVNIGRYEDADITDAAAAWAAKDTVDRVRGESA